MSLVDYALSLGGELVQSVDLRTGEILRAREDGRNAGSEYRPTRNGARDLSPCHISPRIEYRAGASVLTAKRAKTENRSKQEEDERKDTKRGKISGFSAKSRNRLMRLLASVRRDRLPLFVTLTYPREFPDIRQAKRDLDVLIKRLARRFPAVAGVWKLEPQERGV